MCPSLTRWKCHPLVKVSSFVQQICFGFPYRPLFMKSNPKVGRKILQYCFENLGGHAFRCFDLSSQATRRGQSKTSMPFEDKEDAEIDEGFGYFFRTAPRSSCEMAQLRWQTKELRNKSSPIFGWPGALISQLSGTCPLMAPWQRRNHCHPCSMTVPSSPPWRRFGTLISLLWFSWASLALARALSAAASSWRKSGTTKPGSTLMVIPVCVAHQNSTSWEVSLVVSWCATSWMIHPSATLTWSFLFFFFWFFRFSVVEFNFV